MLLPESGWEPVNAGESDTEVFRRGAVYAKCCGPAGVGELLAERDRVEWLSGTSIPGAAVLDWIEGDEGAALLTSTVPGVAAIDLPWSDKLVDSFALTLRAFHELPLESCPFERRLDDVVGQAEDVVRRGAVNPDFLTDEWRLVQPEELLARLHAELPSVREKADLVVCHGDACLPNFLFDPDTLDCTGAIDVGRLGIADRYADLALVRAQLQDEWSIDADRFFATYGLTPDPQRLAFYHLLDPLTWG
nr:aminoglycoside 3'-phosphotransferase [Kribbella catacumbae]